MKVNNPFSIFEEWLNEARDNLSIKEPNSFNLATTTKDGFPSNRTVLLKDYSNDGFAFYTNLESRKGLELKENPRVSLCFYWEAINKQIRIEGEAKLVTNKEADKYFNTRPLKSRLGAWASKQSRPMEGNIDLLKNAVNHSLKTKMNKVGRPPFWSGFRVVPQKIEFWQNGAGRLHERTLFSRKINDSTWLIQRLYP